MTLKEFSEDFYNAYQTVDSLCADGYDPHLTLSNMAQSMTKSGEFMRSVLTINLIYNLKISKQSYAKGILLLILPMVRY